MLNLEQTHYYLCSYPLGNGSIVQPGNWGRIVRKYPLSAKQIPFLAVREYIYEQVRASMFAALPSRLNANFLFENRADALEFRRTASRSLDICYGVTIVEPTLPVHRGCLNALWGGQVSTIETIEKAAKRYWSGVDIQKAELLTLSSIRIEEQIEIGSTTIAPEGGCLDSAANTSHESTIGPA